MLFGVKSEIIAKVDGEGEDETASQDNPTRIVVDQLLHASRDSPTPVTSCPLTQPHHHPTLTYNA